MLLIERYKVSVMKRLHIVAAIIFNKERDEIFITKRHKDAHKGGFWELPGGKVEVNETTEEAIIRELFEEIGIEVLQLTHFQYLEYDYPDKSLKFDFFSVTDFANIPFGKEGQIGKWVSINMLCDYAFPEANDPILEKLVKLYKEQN